MKRVLVAIMAMALVIAMVGAGTSAYFYDEVRSNDNTLTTGTLDLQVSNNGTDWSTSAVTATWVSPEGWAPGKSFTAAVKVKNAGSIDVTYLGKNWTNLRGTANGVLADYIEVVGWKEYNPTTGIWYDYLGPGQEYQNLVKTSVAGRLTLKELMQSYYGAEPADTAAAPLIKENEFGKYVRSLTDSLAGNGYDIVPSGIPAIKAGGVYQLEMTFKLMEDVPNELQGAYAQFDLTFTGAQNINAIP